jgi:hypothetical protein
MMADAKLEKPAATEKTEDSLMITTAIRKSPKRLQ